MSALALPTMFSLILTLLLGAAVVLDLFRFRIPNLISLAVIGLFLLKAGSLDEVGPWLPHLLTSFAVLVLGFLAFACRLLGGGDAKLMAVLALWFGPTLLPSFIVITGMTGGCLALVLLAVRRVVTSNAMPAGPGRSTLTPGLLDPGAPVPYALPIAIAALWLEWL